MVFLYVFLPACLVASWLTSRTRAQNVFLLLASLFFYAWGEPIYVILLLLTCFVIWLCGILLGRARSRRARRGWLVAAIIFALASLVYFKYTGFMVEILNTLPFFNFQVPQITLPIGISFYTFQALTYIIDLYRGEIRIQRSYARFLLYVSLFPQLIAGPIVRYADIERELHRREITLDGMAAGILRFLGGLAKKVLIANYASEIVELCLESGHFSQISAATAILGIMAFAIQIYFDFSGYSDMAIGLGLMFGFHFLENFKHPYISSTITEFWRRWHISLSTFFRDYVYIPLGGNKRHRFRNTLIVWFLTGLWHGANLNFVVWGLYYFLLLMLERILILPHRDKIPRLIRHLWTMLAVLVGWTLFYFTETARFLTFWGRIFAPGLAGFADIEAKILWKQHILFILLAAVFSTPLLPWIRKRFKDPLHRLEYSRMGGFLRTAGALFLLFVSTASLVASSYNPFLYFRF
ncbi:MAG TPA: MBOAT family O-acyltransferase [Bacillota bacterium]|nr:MBOAT family O-acyltransferase [Bacillota bacterium]